MAQHELPIARQTELITIRQVDGREVFTYTDMANGLQVKDDTVRRAYARNADSWEQAETGVGQIVTPSGTQEVRWFTARGAMRFCRFIKSGRSDALFSHLLDLWEAQRADTLVAVPVTETDKLAATVNQLAGLLGGAVVEVRTIAEGASAKADEAAERLSVVEEQVKQTDPREIEERMFTLHAIKKALVEGTKDRTNPVTFREFWAGCGKAAKVASFQNRMGLTIEKMEAAIDHARRWAFTEGVNPPTLFDQDGDSKAV